MLKELIARAEILVKDEYTADSWATLMFAIEVAKKALVSADQAIVDEVVGTLDTAMNALVSNKDSDIVEKPTGTPVEKPTEKNTGTIVDDPGDDLEFADPMFRDLGCGGVIGTSAVVVALLLGMVAIKKKED
jgi:hypothetical protein